MCVVPPEASTMQKRCCRQKVCLDMQWRCVAAARCIQRFSHLLLFARALRAS